MICEGWNYQKRSQRLFWDGLKHTSLCIKGTLSKFHPPEACKVVQLAFFSGYGSCSLGGFAADATDSNGNRDSSEMKYGKTCRETTPAALIHSSAVDPYVQYVRNNRDFPQINQESCYSWQQRKRGMHSQKWWTYRSAVKKRITLQEFGKYWVSLGSVGLWIRGEEETLKSDLSWPR